MRPKGAIRFGYDQCEEDATKGSNPLWVKKPPFISIKSVIL